MTVVKGKWARVFFWSKLLLVATLILLMAAAGWLVIRELRTSAYQARFFSRLADKAQFAVGDGRSEAVRFPASAPYDDRMGYAKLPQFLDRLTQRGFDVETQARMSPGMLDLVDQGYFAPYREKVQGGLAVNDCRGASLYQQRSPERVIQRFADLPPLWVQSLLFIENRELLDPAEPKRNPAVEWARLAVAVFGAVRTLGGNAGETPGGSTLATQIEKYRHSPNGRTASMGDKLQQMGSASLRAYLQGEDTTASRQAVVVTYLNTMPLSAKAGFGEVHGIGDGLWAWYGRDFAEVQRILKNQPADGTVDADAAHLFKEVLSLLISQRRPSYYLEAPTEELEAITNTHLRLLANAGVIPVELKDVALASPLTRRVGRVPSSSAGFVQQKASTAVRTHLAGLLGNSLYELDRLDLRVETTFDSEVQQQVTEFLRGLRDPERVKALGLNQRHLLAKGDPGEVIYSFNLYEQIGGRNVLRVQTDNLNQPLNINQGSKLDLGSTAKLRTLVTYLDIVEKLHRRLSTLDDSQLRELSFDRRDVLSTWAVSYLLQPATDKSLRPMLDAALARRYSANPQEVFFTGGGEHRFGNFSAADNNRVVSVQEALRNSINLVFVRLMRDVVQHYMFLVPGSSAQILRDADDPRRTRYLERFADQEGQVFLRRFLTKYGGKSPQAQQELLLEGLRLSDSRLAAVHRSIAPQAPFDVFKAFVVGHLPTGRKDADSKRLERLYEQYAPDNMSLADRGYLAGVHPLELWLLGHLQVHPQATQTQVMEASVTERQAVYKWLFSTHRKSAQDRRIQTLLEREAFLEVHRQWSSMGYPFGTLVSSYATALGASADRPGALAEFMGILVNDGNRLPQNRIRSIHFAEKTPYETSLQPRPLEGDRVLEPEVARAVREAILDVVEEGTARRVLNAFVGQDGTALPVGGKTGTGDQRFNTYGERGQLLVSRVVNRSATFVFLIGDRFYGTITAFVPGEKAAQYGFTSGLPVQLLKQLAPTLMPLLEPKRDLSGEAQTCLG
ncbi:transglycosylase domain-containing protein [Hydrogenophaga sp. PAMC20947]|uniref:transglycosylase domain-containing protein n=1 Tax=Hydrogenophaga sp. PAMC20947 TaxID=2565558 RepID=UPI00109DD315|nr:transglycosylase domain-containing protein [Hydrogenophaga sp. PAMC20947]QCB45236.1 penicillin-binding protein [Hydrogenophaga sp. PAMC20947]